MPKRAMTGAAIALFVTLAALPANAGQDDPVAGKDPIDLALDACLAAPDGQSTMGMIACRDTAYAAWDRELNVAYQAALAALDPASAKLLRTSQRAWIAFRDAERGFWRGPWTEDRGTLIRVTLDQANVDLVRGRVLALRSYFEP